MSVLTLRPNGVWSLSPSVTLVGASIDGAVADDSDATYVEFDGAEYVLWQLGDLALPAGAVIKSAAVRARLAAVSGPSPAAVAGALEAPDTTAYVTDSVVVSSTTPTTFSYASSSTPPTDPQMDAARVRIRGYSGGAFFRVYAVYVDVVYAARPTLVVTLPTGTVTDTNLPLVSWTPTFDADAGSYSSWSLFIYSAAQYGAGGFTPGTSAATYGHGAGDTTGAGAATSHQMTEPLVNGTYRAYVKVGRSDSILAPHESDWAYSEFTINVALPAVPTITVTAESSSGRNKIVLASNAGAATTDVLDLERSLDGGTTWVPVRHEGGLVARVVGTSGTWYDYEAPNGVQVLYRARALHNYSGLYAASAWTQNSATWSSTSWWLKNPADPSLNQAVTLVTYGDVVKAARQGHFQPVGSSTTITVRDTRASAAGASTIRTNTTAERDAFEAVAELSATLLFQGPLAAGEPDRYISVGDMSAARLIENINHSRRTHTMPWVEVEQPPGVSVPAVEVAPPGALEALTSLSSATSLTAIGVA